MSDNNSGVHPIIMDRIIKENKGHNYSYGEDKTSKESIDLIKSMFSGPVDVFYLATGTGANIVGLSSLLRPFESVVSLKTGHINVDECNSLERFSGSKIIGLEGKDGKLDLKALKTYLDDLGDVHRSQPKVISISQPTEEGILYSLEELREISKFAKENNMYFHMDGARIANALVSLDLSLKEMTEDIGLDILSFGGTKNGMMIGEAIISFNQDIKRTLAYTRKQAMQLFSKMRFISCQFIAYLEKDLWLENARHSNEMADYLRAGLRDLGIRLKGDLKTNMTFAYFSEENLRALKPIDFYLMDEETGLSRLVTSFDTKKREIDEFLYLLK